MTSDFSRDAAGLPYKQTEARQDGARQRRANGSGFAGHPAGHPARMRMVIFLTAAVIAAVFAMAGANVHAAQEGAAQAPADLQAGAKIAEQQCAACHGADGNSALPVNPNLAAQHPEYLIKQLSNFNSVDGALPLRENAIMAGFAAGLKPEDMRNLAAHFSAQTLTPAVAGDKTLIEAGQKIYRAGVAAKGVPACAGCHGPTGAGIPAQYPMLHGQYAEYTASQLTAFRQGTRKNNVAMTGIAARLSDVEIKAVSEYIAGVR